MSGLDDYTAAQLRDASHEALVAEVVRLRKRDHDRDVLGTAREQHLATLDTFVRSAVAGHDVAASVCELLNGMGDLHLMAQLLGPVLDALRTKKPKNFQAAAFTFEGDSWDLELRRVGGESMAMKYAAAVDELERSRPVVDAAIAWQAAFFVDGAPSLSGDGETTVEQENAVDALDVALDDYHAKEGP